MSTTLKYLGDALFYEEQITGSKRIWNYGQTAMIDSVSATRLLTTGLFENNAPVVEVAEHQAEHAAMEGLFTSPVLTTAQLAALTTTGVASFSTSQVLALTTTQLAALCANNDILVAAIKKLGL